MKNWIENWSLLNTVKQISTELNLIIQLCWINLTCLIWLTECSYVQFTKHAHVKFNEDSCINIVGFYWVYQKRLNNIWSIRISDEINTFYVILLHLTLTVSGKTLEECHQKCCCTMLYHLFFGIRHYLN